MEDSITGYKRMVEEVQKSLKPGEKAEEVLAKASTAAAAVAESLLSGDQGAQPPANMDEWIGLYTNAPWIYAGTFAIATTCAQLDFILQEELPGGELKDIPEHYVLDLLKKPNEGETGFDLKEALFIYLETAGACYWESVPETVGTTGISRPGELYTMRPSRITPVPAKDGKSIEKYVFQTKRYAKKTDMRPENVVPFRYFGPLQDWLGQSSLQAAVDEIVLDKAMMKWNQDFFIAGTALQGILETEQTLYPHDLRALTEMFKEMLAGKGRLTPVLGKGLKYKALGKDPKEIEFRLGQRANCEVELAVLGVPHAKVGLLEDAKFSNYQLQERAFHRDTIVPKLRKVESALNCYLVPRFPDLADGKHFLRFDRTPLLLEDQEALTKRVTEEIAHGLMTPNEGRKILGKEPGPATLDGYFIDKRLVPVGTIEEKPTDAAEEEFTTKREQDDVIDAIERVHDEVADGMKEMEQRIAELERNAEAD